MGRIKNNALATGFSGRLGDDLVFKQMGTRTFFSRKGVNTKTPTPAQRANRNVFGIHARPSEFGKQKLPNRSNPPVTIRVITLQTITVWRLVGARYGIMDIRVSRARKSGDLEVSLIIASKKSLALRVTL